jgi:hypothetical protein
VVSRIPSPPLRRLVGRRRREVEAEEPLEYPDSRLPFPVGPVGRRRRGREDSRSERLPGPEERRDAGGRFGRPRGSDRGRRERGAESRRFGRDSAVSAGGPGLGRGSTGSGLVASSSGSLRTRRRRIRRGRRTLDSSIIPRPYPLEVTAGSRTWTEEIHGELDCERLVARHSPARPSPRSKHWETTGSRVGTGFDECPRGPANAPCSIRDPTHFGRSSIQGPDSANQLGRNDFQCRPGTLVSRVRETARRWRLRAAAWPSLLSAAARGPIRMPVRGRFVQHFVHPFEARPAAVSRAPPRVQSYAAGGSGIPFPPARGYRSVRTSFGCAFTSTFS